MTKEDKALKSCINKMFDIANCDLKYEDVLERKDDWYDQYTWTKEDQEEWYEWCVKEIKKDLRCTKEKAKREAGWLLLNYGLKTEK
jgi:hypothetical protein